MRAETIISAQEERNEKEKLEGRDDAVGGKYMEIESEIEKTGEKDNAMMESRGFPSETDDKKEKSVRGDNLEQDPSEGDVGRDWQWW